MSSEQTELVAVKDVSMLSEAYESHHFCQLQNWSDDVAVAGLWACLLGPYELLMSDWSWVSASMMTSGLWYCMEEQLAQEHLGWKLISVPRTYILICSDFFHVSVSTYSLSHKWLIWFDVKVPAWISLREYSLNAENTIQKCFFIQKHHLSFIAWVWHFVTVKNKKNPTWPLFPHTPPVLYRACGSVFRALRIFFASILSSLYCFHGVLWNLLF